MMVTEKNMGGLTHGVPYRSEVNSKTPALPAFFIDKKNKKCFLYTWEMRIDQGSYIWQHFYF